MMQFGLLALSVMPMAFAATAYSVPQDLAMKAADTTNDCNLPNDYNILGLKASKNAVKNTTRLEFTFVDDTTNITTACHLNSTSKPISSGSSATRYSCDDATVEFIWENEDRELWMIEQVCAASDGTAEYEVSGSVRIWLKCPEASGPCTTNQTDYTALFSSLNPITPPTA